MSAWLTSNLWATAKKPTARYATSDTSEDLTGDLGQTYDLGLGAEFAVNGIATDAAVHDDGVEADLWSKAEKKRFSQRRQDRKENLQVRTRAAAGAEHRSGCKRNFDLQGESAGFRDRHPVFGHALQVEFDGLPDVARDFLDGLSGGGATWQIGDKSGHVVWPAFDNYSVPLHGLARSPA